MGTSLNKSKYSRGSGSVGPGFVDPKIYSITRGRHDMNAYRMEDMGHVPKSQSHRSVSSKDIGKRSPVSPTRRGSFSGQNDTPISRFPLGLESNTRGNPSLVTVLFRDQEAFLAILLVKKIAIHHQAWTGTHVVIDE